MSNEDPSSSRSQLLFYQTEDGQQRIEVRLEEETVWLTRNLMADLFQTTPQNITTHLQNLFSEKELDSHAVTKEVPISIPVPSPLQGVIAVFWFQWFFIDQFLHDSLKF